MSFFYSQYESIVAALLSADKLVGGVADFLSCSDQKNRVILRHDVDRFPSKSYSMSKFEKSLGVRSTYYFRVSNGGRFPERFVSLISQMGHEIGYHYEDLSFCSGNRDAALERFCVNLQSLRKIAPCSTVSMHGAPLSKYNNQDLLRYENIIDCGLIGDAVSSVHKYNPYYMTDTGGRWLSEQTNLRDRVGKEWPRHAVPSDDNFQFIEFIKITKDPLYISTHPERWSQSHLGCGIAKGIDAISNSAKLILKYLR